MKRPEPVQVIKQRREALLRALVDGVPYIGFLGVQFDRRGDELTAILPFRDSLIGNPRLPALHGGATAAFLEISDVSGRLREMLSILRKCCEITKDLSGL